MNEAGRWSDNKRNEGQLLCDIFGLESLVDEITYKLASDAPDEPTSTAILGPFWRADAPKLSMGENIVQNMEGIGEGDRTWMHGIVTDYRTGEPIEGAVLDVWHTAPNGLYEQQDPGQPEMNLRGRFTTGKDGKYDFYCLRPVPYPIPFDGPAGKILQALDRHPYRPAHIHFIVSLDPSPFPQRRNHTATNSFANRSRRRDTSPSSRKSSTGTASTSKTMPFSRSRRASLWTSSHSKGTPRLISNFRTISN